MIRRTLFGRLARLHSIEDPAPAEASMVEYAVQAQYQRCQIHLCHIGVAAWTQPK
jgi:dihydroorotase-like cyclic amidohydrolase